MCEKMNGHLLTIDSAEEENTVNENKLWRV